MISYCYFYHRKGFKIQELLLAPLIFLRYCLVVIFILSGCGYRITAPIEIDDETAAIKNQVEGNLDHLSTPVEKVTVGDCKIGIGYFRNKTYVPGLEDRLRSTISEEFIKRGCDIVSPSNDTFATSPSFPASGDRETAGLKASIMAEITDIRLSIVAEKSGGGIALYEVNIKVDFRIQLQDGRVISRSLSSPFITDFKSGTRIEDIIIERDREIQKAMRDLAYEVIRLLERNL